MTRRERTDLFTGQAAARTEYQRRARLCLLIAGVYFGLAILFF